MMILVTGGSGSGKSAFAEDCVLALGEKKRIYIATMFPFDEESKNVLSVTETCVKVRDLRRWNVIQVLKMYRQIRTARSFWNVCPILWQTKCFRNPVPEKIR